MMQFVATHLIATQVKICFRNGSNHFKTAASRGFLPILFSLPPFPAISTMAAVKTNTTRLLLLLLHHRSSHNKRKAGRNWFLSFL
jgi:hypothetical protein